MFAASESVGFIDFEIRSCYRDAERQVLLFERDPVSGLTARPGQSEHQTGLAMGIGTWRGPFLSEANAAHRDWVARHCWDFGFVVRYPEGHEDVTGIAFEPWHLRFVGREVAQEMKRHGWVLEEWQEAMLGGR